MFGIMLQKLWHKKWMNICLLLGCVLLTATVVSFPLYRAAAYDRMVNDEFSSYVTAEGKYPTLVTSQVSSNRDKTGNTLNRMAAFPNEFFNALDVTPLETFYMLNLSSAYVSSDTGRADAKSISLKLGSIENVDKHIKILSGEMYSDTGLTEDGAIEVIVSQSCLVEQGLLINEYFTYDELTLNGGKPIRLYIKGIYDTSDEQSYFWQVKPERLNDILLCNPAIFTEYFTGDNAGRYNIAAQIVPMFDYNSIKATDVERIIEKTEYLTKESAYKSVIKSTPYIDVLESYKKKLSRISATLIILQVPVLVMLAAFLFMISGQMYEMEKNEISVIKSRGSSGTQIIRLYFYQGTLITVLGAVLGMPLGSMFARILGSTRNFLEFDFSQSLEVIYTEESYIYAIAAVVVCLLSITIPSLKHSRITIVNLKQSKALRRKSWWEKLFLDVILLGVSLYGFYNFNKNSKDMSSLVLQGESLDPLLYVSSSLFILGAGLFFLRIQPYIVKFIYLIGKRWWGPASHVSFMENIKNGRKQQLIMLFLIMTISLGMYHATVARTILDNAVENTEYLSATDVIIQESWHEITDRYGTSTGEFIVPDINKYNTIPGVKAFTKVINDQKGTYTLSDKSKIIVDILGINTKEFGEQTMVDRSLLDKHYYSYLNDLAVVENGFLVSSNFSTKYGMEIGDTITVTSSRNNAVAGKIVGFFDYFPGYIDYEMGLNPDGTVYNNDKFMVVAHFDYLTSKWGTYPYEVWIDLEDNTSIADIYNWINDNDVTVKRYVNKQFNMQSTLEDPLLQGTNGVLTMGFVVTIVLCAVGYLIYWVMSIRERELIFGVLRATGFHKGEIFKMLLNEQIFSGVFSVLAGIGIGKLTSILFVPILQQAYASENQALPMRLITVASDMYRLYGVIASVMVLVLLVLVFILFRMNVTKALKLGEE